ncbi:diguanylate cyclase [Amycolatopsis sp. NPDC059021]|uniref:GGDEF domain-containing protein n=1 Tax=Amycolatopsis sp. NPDC059021 TaxID=3346704 RepID=UPI00366C71C9
MVGESAMAAGDGRRRGRGPLIAGAADWALWRLPRRGLVWYLLVVDVVAVAGTALAAVRFPPSRPVLLPFVVLLAGLLVCAELCRTVERARADVLDPGIDIPWIFAGVLILPPGAAAGLVVVSGAYRWLRVRRRAPHRQVFGVAATVCAAVLASVFLGFTVGDPLYGIGADSRVAGLIFVSGLVFFLVNAGLVRLLGAPASSGYVFDAAMVALGVVLAVLLAGAPLVVPLLAGAVVVLHRGSLTRARREVTLDSLTAVLTAESWREAAKAEAARLRRGPGAAALLLDLDRFGQLNDWHGRGVGDAVLRAVADALRAEVRSADLVGRSGGGEFAVLLPATGRFDALAIAERLRLRVAATAVSLKSAGDAPQFAGTTVSIGVAALPGDGDTLDDVLAAARGALDRAKRSGRNRTVCAETGPAS